MRIQNPGAGQALLREYKTGEAPEMILSNIISPVVVISDLSGSAIADVGYPRDCFGFAISAAGGVGTNGQCVLNALAASPPLVYKITGAMISKPSDGRVNIRTVLGSVGIAGLTEMTGDDVGKSWSDFRVPGFPSLFLGESTPLTAAIDGQTRMTVEVLDLTSVLVPLNIVMGADGSALVVQSDTANEDLRCGFYWTEYLLEAN